MKVMIVEDDQRMRSVLEDMLKWEGFETCSLEQGGPAIERAREFRPQVILLNQVLANRNGLDILENFKANPDLESIPVIMITESASNQAVSHGVSCGAHDCVSKPFVPSLLFKKIRGSIRLSSVSSISSDHVVAQNHGLTFDVNAYQAFYQGKDLYLTLTEFKILYGISLAAPNVLRRQDLQSNVFGGIAVSNRTLDVHVCNLRKKIIVCGLNVRTMRGVGFRLEAIPQKTTAVSSA